MAVMGFDVGQILGVVIGANYLSSNAQTFDFFSVVSGKILQVQSLMQDVLIVLPASGGIRRIS